MKDSQCPDLTSFDALFADASVPKQAAQVAPESFAAASNFWKVILSGAHVSPRMKELVLLALHASVSALDSEAIQRHVARARLAGASPEDILDVLVSIVGVANHALYNTVPVLMSELKAAGHPDAELPELSPENEAVKQEFIATRGFWPEPRDSIARLMPAYFGALSGISMEPWKSGVLTAKERELIYVSIDSSPTHFYAAGLAMHIRHALEHGATRGELSEVLQLAASMGLEGLVLGTEALFGCDSAMTGR